jgi:hypothetical protein
VIRRAGAPVKVCSIFQPCFLAVERTDRMTAKSFAPSSERNPPENFWRSFILRPSCSARLLVKGTAGSVWQRRASCLRCSSAARGYDQRVAADGHGAGLLPVRAVLRGMPGLQRGWRRTRGRAARSDPASVARPACGQGLVACDRTRSDKSDLGVTVQIGDTDRAGIFDDPVGLALVVCLPC